MGKSVTEVVEGSFSIANAYLESLESGVVELEEDWYSASAPLIRLKGAGRGFLQLEPIDPVDFGLINHCYVDESGALVFVLRPEMYSALDYETTRFYLAGDFNDWGNAVKNPEWELEWMEIGGKRRLVFRDDDAKLDRERELRFKFVTERKHWLPVDMDADNAQQDSEGRWNYLFRPSKTGRHRFRFLLDAPIDLSENNHLAYRSDGKTKEFSLHPGEFFFSLSSDKELGAIVGEGQTVFRLFAPRAKWVKVGYFMDLDDPESIEWILLEKGGDFVWEATVKRELGGGYYWFRLDGPDGGFGLFDPNFKILDPYAKAAVSAAGPGIIIDDRQYPDHERLQYAAPQWQDLVVLECHVQDLTAKLPQYEPLADRPRGFPELTRYVRSDAFYPARLGVNAVELQPIQENDAKSQGEYHWGYMTANFFSPNSKYGSSPDSGSQVKELRALVDAFHERGMAVIADVVYNHVGEPAHLMYIDKEYYFHLGGQGELTNWSGCGNDLRCDTPMARRLIVESLKRLALFYGIDGFRFDLADLVGKETLVEIERELKKVRPDIILIAEPWSFRGHIGMELRDTGYSSWNDGYREFIKNYVLGKGNQEGLEYFLKGSPTFYASWPAQTVNYVESHDDRTWIDDITENHRNNGHRPTANDGRRTRLMISALMMSVGIPMLHAGQDFMMSKGGFRNSYQRGDLNALSYERELEYPGATEYARRWVQFRRSELGRLLRHYERVDDSFFAFLKPETGSALACVYNANRAMGPELLLYGINPSFEAVEVELGSWSGLRWKQICDHDRFWGSGPEREPVNRPEDTLRLPELSCGLWQASG